MDFVICSRAIKCLCVKRINEIERTGMSSSVSSLVTSVTLNAAVLSLFLVMMLLPSALLVVVLRVVAAAVIVAEKN